MKLDIQHISVKENWKDWLLDSIQIYKAGMLSHTVIYLSAFIAMFFIKTVFPYDSDMSSILLLLYFIFIAPYFLIYMFGIIYKKDKKSPEFKNIDFSSYTLKRAFKMQTFILMFFIFVAIISSGFSQPENVVAEAGDTSVHFFEYGIYDYLIFSGTYTFKYSEFVFYFSYFVLYVFCGKTLFQSLYLFNVFLIEKNNFGVFALSLLFPILVAIIFALLPPVFKLFYIFITPFFMSWHYVIFKHGFFGMKPEKQEEREKVDNNVYHMT